MFYIQCCHICTYDWKQLLVEFVRMTSLSWIVSSVTPSHFPPSLPALSPSSLSPPSLPLTPLPPSPLLPPTSDALIATWREKGCASFWRVVRQFPVLRSHIVCWKTCFVIHRAFRDGFPDVRTFLLYYGRYKFTKNRGNFTMYIL